MTDKVPKGWKKARLGEVAEIVMGQSPPSSSYNEKSEGLAFYQGVVDFGYRFVSPRVCCTEPKKVIDENFILLSVRAPVGEVNLTKEECAIGRGNAGLRAKNGQKLFLYYLLKYNIRKLQISAEGTVFSSINRSTIENLEINIPEPIDEQKVIASVLSSLDDKIDLLHRQNKTLESMAAALFRKWFIEDAKEDWEERPLSFFGRIICGKTPSKKKLEYFNGNIPFIKIPDMHSKTFIFETSDSLSEKGKISQLNKTLPPKSICVSCIATVGLIAMNAYEAQTNQQINSIIPHKKFYRYYLYLTMKTLKELLISMASGGTATLNLNTKNFSNISVPLPEDNILRDFHKLVEPLFDKIFENQQQIRILEKLRDTLLPKLMSGEVRVRIW